MNVDYIRTTFEQIENIDKSLLYNFYLSLVKILCKKWLVFFSYQKAKYINE